MIDETVAGEFSAGEDKIVIRQSHRRAISVTLTLFDAALCGFDRWAEGQEVRSVFFSRF